QFQYNPNSLSSFSITIPTPPKTTLFPYTTLFRSVKKSKVKPSQDNGLPMKKLEKRSIVTCSMCHEGGHKSYKCKLRRKKKEDKRSEEHTSEPQSLRHLVCRLLLEKKKKKKKNKKK